MKSLDKLNLSFVLILHWNCVQLATAKNKIKLVTFENGITIILHIYLTQSTQTDAPLTP